MNRQVAGRFWAWLNEPNFTPGEVVIGVVVLIVMSAWF
jgi:hypothetical protein